MNHVKISNYQLALIAIAYFFGSSTISNPGISAKRDAWLAVILGILFSFLLITIYLFLSKINKRRNLVEIAEYCFGKIAGRIICAIYILFFLYNAAYNTRTFSEFIVTVSFPDTPLIAIILLLSICAFYLARSGLSTMGKVSEILTPVLPIAVIIVTTSLVYVSDYTGFKPMFLEIPAIFSSAIDITSNVFGDFVVFLMILPYTNDIKGRFKATYWAIFVTGLMTLIIATRNIQIIGPALSDYIQYPSHIAAQLIPGISIDVLVDINILIGSIVKVAVSLYAMSKITSQIFNIKEFKPVVTAFALFNIPVTFWIFPNAMDIFEWAKSLGDTLISLPVQLIIPVIMLIITIIKNKKNNMTAAH